MYSSTLFTSLALTSSALAGYEVKWDYSGASFFDNFEFQPDSSFTNGFAQYVSKDEATAMGLASIVDNKARIGVDMNNTYELSSTGRKSVRLQSNEMFNRGLLVADFAHVPVAGCGQWPAFWVYRGEQAEGYSEIDILENVDKTTANTHSFYTSEECSVNFDVGSPLKTDNCHYDPQGAGPQGCSFGAEEGTFNQAFNDNYQIIALQVEADTMKIWHFGKDEVPADLTAGTPDPSTWRAPTVALSPKSCDFQTAFSQFHVIINITFCGSWAGGPDWDAQCAAETGTDCNTWVANNPEEFKDTFFGFNSVKLYQLSA
ncbi:hypothetical protein BU23DRAFT_477459 [Bimuria novae-zelandiae CBS 107.79]|uniref:GH16 domain-containing protein n=1 Tax=Bimuria novae-zelandiae CBS 107.79 TaxID=1447943 RepID=A0A6A5UVX6_9PLEO|nr:hypothetical protein BU23DRAFT_477459 [Bimuria novae-zelandiae CBS 107.79]